MLLSDFFKYFFLLRFECQYSSHTCIEIGDFHNPSTDDTRNVDDQDVCGLFLFEFLNTKKKKSNLVFR